jgi:hypothetical protein
MQSSSSSNDEFLNALRTSGADDTRSWLFELMVRASEEGARRALAQQVESLEPLGAILGCTPDAARMRISRDGELASLGMRVGRRLLFRRSDVMVLLAERQRQSKGSQPSYRKTRADDESRI